MAQSTSCPPHTHSDLPSLRSANAFLDTVLVTGQLGSGQTESAHNPSPFRAFFVTLPWVKLLFQFSWSSFVVSIAYLLADRSKLKDTLDNLFWESRLNVPSSVSFAVGWALFVLLGFFIREASKRNREGSIIIHNIGYHVKYTLRTLLLNYPKGTWHHDDVDRIVRHLIAYPIALKMSLRGEREAAQLIPFLHPADVEDIMNADVMHVHCARVVRAYIYSSDDNTPQAFKYADTDKTPAGGGVRYMMIDYVDRIDYEAQKAMTIAEFRPSIAYVNHLKIFLYIWMLFLPLALVGSSGWFTILWAVIITHGIGMLINIASDLNDPYGFDIYDIKLNRISAANSKEALEIYLADRLNLSVLIDPTHETPRWFDTAAKEEDQPSVCTRSTSTSSFLSLFKLPSASTYVPLILYLAWCCFIVFLTWGLTRNDENTPTTTRWWSIYIPIDSSTATYVSLGIFLLLGFWLSDSYSRYWGGLQIWQTVVPPIIDDLLVQFALVTRPGIWHERDHERIFAHITAIPYVAKQILRDSRDFSELGDIMSPKDVLLVSSAQNPIEYVFDVINSYVVTADTALDLKINPGQRLCIISINVFCYRLHDLEFALNECKLLKLIPTPPAFTSHLKLFTIFWLALLPLTLVVHDGFISFLYLIPIGYSLIKLLTLGVEMMDPFGDDEHDLPLDQFCKEIKEKVRNAYHDTRGGFKALVRDTGYVRSQFDPILERDQVSDSEKASSPVVTGPTVLKSLLKFLSHFPKISPIPVVISLIWSVVVVIASWRLSFLWPEELRKDCAKWCSPIDVQGSVLGNVGFALFMILGFRTSDAINRYEDGAKLLNEMKRRVRDLVLDVLMYWKDGLFHPGDKERVVAHLAQFPLYFRDMMLLGEDEPPHTEDCMLTENDLQRYKNSASPIEYLLRTVESYVMLPDMKFSGEFIAREDSRSSSIVFNCHVHALRNIVAQVRSIKRFPVISSYTRHQYLFTALWLALLPMAMTKDTGFFTILWSPLISYVVLCMESIATKLVDPYGTDSEDLPVEDMCKEAVSGVLDASRSLDWGTQRMVRESRVDSAPIVGSILQGKNVTSEYILAHFSKSGKTDVSDTKCDQNHNSKPAPTLYAHLLRSVPWSSIIVVTLWTVAGCSISYLSRDRESSTTVRWWKSYFSISTNVGVYVSFAAFTLLGFYVGEAFSRYNAAGDVWGNSLRKSCHLVTSYFMTILPRDLLHSGDHERLVGHIAALPLVLKHELRDSRDLREVTGLLSTSDIGRIQTATSMSQHCIDVIYGYWNEVLGQEISPKHVIFPVEVTSKLTGPEIVSLEKAVNHVLYVKKFKISPGFVHVLNLFLGMFFFIIPFILSEISGWFTILWVPIIAYGVIGMYNIAGELENPFGTDLNDLDLDKLANEIVTEVFMVMKQWHRGHGSLITESDVPGFWHDEQNPQDSSKKGNIFYEYDSMSLVDRMIHNLKLAISAVPIWLIAIATAWSTFAVSISYFVSKYLPQISGNTKCPQWFCTAIAIDSSVSEYIGFALFFLLGFRLYDSHWRYVRGLELWRNEILGKLRIVCNRLFQAYYAGYWHSGDLERIAGHIAASIIGLKCDLRGQLDEKHLSEVLSKSDVDLLLSSPDRVDYCWDVIRSYLAFSERLNEKISQRQPATINERVMFAVLLRVISEPSSECRRILHISLPYGYVQHLRIFLAIWLLLLPFELVELTGWLTILWVTIISYGIIGIESWAEKLCDPFGTDVTDLPLDAMTEEITQLVNTNLNLYKKGVEPFIRRDRVHLISREDGDDIYQFKQGESINDHNV